MHTFIESDIKRTRTLKKHNTSKSGPQSRIDLLSRVLEFILHDLKNMCK